MQSLLGMFIRSTRRRDCQDGCRAKAAGKPVQVIEAPNYHHLMAESLGNPYGPAMRGTPFGQPILPPESGGHRIA
jgi:hypothetical protein